MEKINEKYYLDSDAHNFVLLKKKMKENKEEVFETIGYYGNINMLYNGLINKEIKDNLGIIKNISEIVKIIDNLKQKNNN